jgi:hypothetical protein
MIQIENSFFALAEASERNCLVGFYLLTHYPSFLSLPFTSDHTPTPFTATSPR